MAAWLKLDEAIYQNIRRHVREELGEEKISLLQTVFLFYHLRLPRSAFAPEGGSEIFELAIVLISDSYLHQFSFPFKLV